MVTDDVYFETLRAEEYARLDRLGVVYLDYAGSGLFAESQVRSHQELLLGSVLGNPHSEHAPSLASTRTLNEARETVLAHFNVSSATHTVCFTANASAAIKLVAESFPFSPDRGLLLTADNHNSVNGIREFAARAAAPAEYLGLAEDLRLAADGGRAFEGLVPPSREASAGLFAFPAQSNFSGVRHPLSLVNDARASGWRVLLDAASFAPTHDLDLSTCPADFVPVSFYKMFGYPTGLGALIARRDALDELRRPWFAGGTVDYVSVQHHRHLLRRDHDGFEDGTANFLAALALPAGFDLLARVGQTRIARRVSALTKYFLDGLNEIRHTDGSRAIQTYGPSGVEDRGGIVAFNVIDRSGAAVPYWTVESAARETGVAIRGGCFCNPGAAERAFGFDHREAESCFDRLGRDFSIPTFAACLGPQAVVGALRVSIGIPTTTRDLDRALELLARSTQLAHDVDKPVDLFRGRVEVTRGAYGG